MTKSDHKRKARPIGPAVVTCDADSITVVIPDVLGKNESHQGGRFLSPATKALRASVQSGAGAWRNGLSMTALADRDHRHGFGQATQGAWRAEILACWDRKRDTIKGRPIGFVAPVGDVDAPIAQVFDALQHAGILDDDARVVEVRAWNLYRKGVRATVVRLVRVRDHVHCESGEQIWCFEQGQLVHHLPLVVETPTTAKPVRKTRSKKPRFLFSAKESP